MNETLLQKISRKKVSITNRTSIPHSPNKDYLKRVTLSPLPPLTDRRLTYRRSSSPSSNLLLKPAKPQNECLDVSFGINDTQSCTYIKSNFPELYSCSSNFSKSTVAARLKPSSTKTLRIGEGQKRMIMMREITPGSKFLKRRKDSAHFPEFKPEDKNKIPEVLVFKKLVRQFQLTEKSRCTKHTSKFAIHYCKQCSVFYCKMCMSLHKHQDDTLPIWRAPSVTDINPYKDVVIETLADPISINSKPIKLTKSITNETTYCTACGNTCLEFTSNMRKEEFKIWGLCEACQNLIFPTSSTEIRSESIFCKSTGPYSELTLDVEIPILSNGICWYSPLHFILSDLIEDVSVITYLQEIPTVAQLKEYISTHTPKNCEEGEIILESCLEEVCQLMVEQHPRLRYLLIQTKDTVLNVDNIELEKVSGIQLEQNTVGKIWMKLRNNLAFSF